MLRRAWLSAVPLLAAVSAALAEEGHGEERPSLFGGDLGNAIWTLVIFFLLLIVLAKFAWKPLLRALQDREKFIRDSLETAKRDRQAAEARLKEYEQRLQKARDEAVGIVDEARRDAEVVKRRIEEEARKNGDALIDRAKREIGIARDTALKDLYQESVQLAMSLAGSVLKRQLTPEDHQRLVQESLAELARKHNGEESE